MILFKWIEEKLTRDLRTLFLEEEDGDDVVLRIQVRYVLISEFGLRMLRHQGSGYLLFQPVSR